MMRPRLALVWHLGTVVLAVTALVLQLVVILSGQGILGSTSQVSLGEQVRRYFSYFTIQSNLLVALAMFWLIQGSQGTLFRVVRLSSLVGITVTGVVAFLALPPSPGYTLINLICDRLLHIAVPLVTLVGWVVFGPRGQVERADVLKSLIWPVLWLVATLTLGPTVDWYPYPFLNAQALGLPRVLVNCAGVAVLFLTLGCLAFWGDRRLRLPTRVGLDQ